MRNRFFCMACSVGRPPGRAWAGLVLHQRAMDDIHCGAVEFVADRQGVPVVNRRMSRSPAGHRYSSSFVT